MEVPAGIPMGFVFVGLFVFLVLFFACIVLGVMTEDKPLRFTLFGAAVALVLVMCGGAYLTMGMEEAKPETAEAAETKPAKPAKPEKPAKPAAPIEPQKEGSVVLVIDEATMTQDADPLQTEHLGIEGAVRQQRGDRIVQRERSRVGRQLGAIEEELNARLLALDAQVQEVNRRFDAQEMDTYDMIFWKSKLKTQQYGLIVKAMDDKQKILEAADFLSDADKAPDLTRIDQRRKLALEKWKEYQAALAELEAHEGVYHRL